MSSRALLTITIAVSVAACTTAPQLSPRAVGCYAVQLDSFPAVFRQMLVPAPPALVRLDTINGGQLEVPVSWLEQQGMFMRRAGLQLMRPGWRIQGARVQLERVGPEALPPDSVVLSFSGGGGQMLASLGEDATGNWNGLAFALTSASPYGEPLVPIRLQRQDCGAVPLGLSR